jgi:hypothetical protein
MFRFARINNKAYSAISYLEVLGYHQLTPEDRQDLKDFFDAVLIFHIFNRLSLSGAYFILPL